MPCSPVYEFHDINVENFADISKILNDSAHKWNLMIIPFAGGASSAVFSAFRKQLQAWKNQGFSLHLHGYRHRANLEFKRSLFGKIAFCLTGGEAEFAGLDKKDSAELLGEALNAWQILQAGEPSGFVPPAWYGSKTLFSLCKEHGFENYGSRFFMWKNGNGAELSIPFSVAGLPFFLVHLVNFCEKIYLRLYRVFKFLPRPRIVLHPIETVATPAKY